MKKLLIVLCVLGMVGISGAEDNLNMKWDLSEATDSEIIIHELYDSNLIYKFTGGLTPPLETILTITGFCPPMMNDTYEITLTDQQGKSYTWLWKKGRKSIMIKIQE